VVGAVVVAGAEQDAFVEVGAAALAPGIPGMVRFAPTGWDGASLRGAGGVFQRQCLALGGGEQALGAAQVEDLTLAVEDRGHDACGARLAAPFGGRDRGSVGE